MKSRKQPRAIYLYAFLSSLLLHFFFLFAFIPSHHAKIDELLASKNQSELKQKENKANEKIQILSQKEVDQILKQYEEKKAQKKAQLKSKEKKKEEKKEEKQEEKKEDLNHKGQVVEIPKPKKEEIPTESKFLSEYNQKVEKETKSRSNAIPQAKIVQSEQTLNSTGNDINGRKDGNPNLKSQQKQSEQKPEQRPDQQAGKNFKTKQEQNFEKDGALEQPKPNQDQKQKQKSQILTEDGLFEHQKANDAQSQKKMDQPQGGGKIGGGMMPTDYHSLLPNLGNVNQAMQNGTIDHLPEIDISDDTSLNSKAFKYAYFFNRVKREVSRNWEILEAYMQNDPRGNVYGIKDRYTVLSITLDLRGIIQKIEIVQESGMPFLDQTAKDAFIKAQPFHEPPKGLVEKDGFIHFRFSFHLGLGRR